MAFTYGAVTLTDNTVLECQSLSEFNGLGGHWTENSWTTTINGQTISNSQIRKVEVGTSITTIPSGFLWGCTALEEVDFGTASITSILSDFCVKCPVITHLEIPRTVTKIGESFLCRCASLQSVNVRSINANAALDVVEEADHGWLTMGTNEPTDACFVNGVTIIADTPAIQNTWLTVLPNVNLPEIEHFRNLKGRSFVKLYGSVGGARKKIEKLYGSVNGARKEIKKVYASVNGRTKLVYEK